MTQGTFSDHLHRVGRVVVQRSGHCGHSGASSYGLVAPRSLPDKRLLLVKDFVGKSLSVTVLGALCCQFILGGSAALRESARCILDIFCLNDGHNFRGA